MSVRVERRGRKPCRRVVNNENWHKCAGIFSLRIASSTLQTIGVKTDGPESVWVCCAGFFCNGGKNGVAPVIRDLGGLEGGVRNAGECRDYVGTKGFKNFGKEPIRVGSLIGVEGFKSSLSF